MFVYCPPKPSETLKTYVFDAWTGMDAYPQATRLAVEQPVRENALTLATDGDLKLSNPAILLCGCR